MTSQIPSFPQPPPPIWQPPSVWQSKCFISVGRFLGVIGNIREGQGYQVFVCLSHRPIWLRVSISLSNSVVANGTFFWQHSIAESTSIVHRDICFLVRIYVHGHGLFFHALLLGRGLPECSGVFKL